MTFLKRHQKLFNFLNYFLFVVVFFFGAECGLADTSAIYAWHVMENVVISVTCQNVEVHPQRAKAMELDFVFLWSAGHFLCLVMNHNGGQQLSYTLPTPPPPLTFKRMCVEF